MSYSMRLFAVPYRVTVCVSPVLMYIAVYLSVCVAAYLSLWAIYWILDYCVCVSELHLELFLKVRACAFAYFHLCEQYSAHFFIF